MSNLKTVLNNLKDNYKLRKLTKNKTIIRETPIYNDFEYIKEINISTNLSFNKYKNIIQEFKDIFNNKFDENNALNLNRNLSTLKIEENSIADFFENSNVCGLYKPRKNKINLIMKNNKEYEELKSTLNHELLHMASCKNSEFDGLSQNVHGFFYKTTVGSSLDEGYTELLNQRYFTKVINNNVYKYERSFASGIEKIVGKEVMEKCYFQADLFNLIKNISFYNNDLNEITDLLVRMELFTKKKKTESEAFDIRLKIGNIYKQKLDLQLSLGLIDRNEYEKKKFLHVDEYTKSNTTYSEDAKIIELNKVYLIDDNGQTHYLKKSKFPVHFTPDEKDISASDLLAIENNKENLNQSKNTI